MKSVIIISVASAQAKSEILLREITATTSTTTTVDTVDMSCFDSIDDRKADLTHNENGRVEKDDLCAVGKMVTGLNAKTYWLWCKNGVLTEDGTHAQATVTCADQSAVASCSTDDRPDLHLQGGITVFANAPQQLLKLCAPGYKVADKESTVSCLVKNNQGLLSVVNSDGEATQCVAIAGSVCANKHWANLKEDIDWSEFQYIEDLCQPGYQPSSELDGTWFKCDSESQQLIDGKYTTVSLTQPMCEEPELDFEEAPVETEPELDFEEEDDQENQTVDISCFNSIAGKASPLPADEEGWVYKDELCADGKIPTGFDENTNWLVCEDGKLIEDGTYAEATVTCAESEKVLNLTLQ